MGGIVRGEPACYHSCPRVAKTLRTRLYDPVEKLDGLNIPMNIPRGRQQNKRLRGKRVGKRGGEQAADFPEALIVDDPLRKLQK